MLTFGVVVLGATDRPRAEAFWSAALGYRVRDDGFGGWVRVLEPAGGTGTMIALQISETPPEDYPRLHFDLHVADAAEQEAEADRLVSLGARRVDWTTIPTTPTSSCWPTPKATGSASSTSGTKAASPESRGRMARPGRMASRPPPGGP
jgi:hypothetical protein